MSEREPITAELRAALDVDREFMRTDGTVVTQTFCVDRGDFERLCDAIDAVHAGLERENAELRECVAVLDNQADSMRETGAWKLGYDEGFASADDWMADNEDAMAEHGWVRLPLDADGVPWNVGDRDEDGDTVFELRLATSGWCVNTDGGSFCRPGNHRHHHAPTVEDVLREFADEMNQNLGMYTGEAIDADEWRDADNKTIAEYAKRLKLAEGEDA